MGLYRNILQYDWNLTVGEYAAYNRYPFQEFKLDPVFKILSLDLDNYLADIEVVESSFLEVGTIYRNQPLEGLRRVKLSTIKTDFRYDTKN